MNKKVRILVIAVGVSPFEAPGSNGAGGGNLYVLHLMQAYKELGIYSELISANGPADSINSEQLQYYYLRAKQIIQNGHFNFIHAIYWPSAIIATKLKRLFNEIPIIYSIISLGLVKEKSLQQRCDVRRIIAEKSILSECSIIASVSEHEKKMAVKYYGCSSQKISVVGRFIDTSLFLPLQTNQELRKTKGKAILFVGRLVKAKGIDRLLECYKILCANISCPPPLWIVGGSPDQIQAVKNKFNTIIDFVKKNGGHICFHGLIEQTAMPSFYKQAVLVCIPSYYEPGARVTFEALSCCAPVVMSRNGYIDEAIKNNLPCILHDFNKPAIQGAEILESVIFGKAKLKKKLAIGREFVKENYNFSEFKGKTSNLLTLVDPAYKFCYGD